MALSRFGDGGGRGLGFCILLHPPTIRFPIDEDPPVVKRQTVEGARGLLEVSEIHIGIPQLLVLHEIDLTLGILLPDRLTSGILIHAAIPFVM